MSEHLKRALDIIGQYDAETIELITTCADCGKKINPQIEADGVAIGPLCDDCKAELHSWVETHCEVCKRELPRVTVPWGGIRVCSDECREEFS